MVSFTKVYALIYQIGLIKNKKVIIIQHFGTFCDFKKNKPRQRNRAGNNNRVPGGDNVYLRCGTCRFNL